MNNQYFFIQQYDKCANLYIYGDIVQFEIQNSDTSAYSIVNQINMLDVDTINVHIDSYGGSVSEGWAIYNSLIRHPAKVITWGDGFVASAAIFPFLAGEQRYASTLSAYYVHEVMTGIDGYAKDLRAAADEIEKMTKIGVNVFTERTKLNKDEVLSMMARETWLSPEDAVRTGIATEIFNDSTPKYIQSMKKQFVQKFITNREDKKENYKLNEKKESIAQLFSKILY